MKRIFLDTNFLLIPANFKIDIFLEIRRICDFQYRLIVLEQSLEELKRIKQTAGTRDKIAANVALSLIQSPGIETMKLGIGPSVDQNLIQCTNPGTDVVATQDIILKRKLKKRHIPIITMRQKKYLVLNP